MPATPRSPRPTRRLYALSRPRRGSASLRISPLLRSSSRPPPHRSPAAMVALLLSPPRALRLTAVLPTAVPIRRPGGAVVASVRDHLPSCAIPAAAATPLARTVRITLTRRWVSTPLLFLVRLAPAQTWPPPVAVPSVLPRFLQRHRRRRCHTASSSGRASSRDYARKVLLRRCVVASAPIARLGDVDGFGSFDAAPLA